MAKKSLLVRRTAWMGALVALFCVLLSCGSEPIAPFVRLRVSGVPAGADKVVITITTGGVTRTQELTAADSFDLITVAFPMGTVGDVTFSLLAYSGMCLVGSGSGNIALTADDVREVQINMTMPSLACGTPAAKIIVQVANGPSSMGTVTTVNPPGGISCGQDCEEIYAVGSSVTLHAEAMQGSFLGWSGACTDTNDCTVSLNASGDYIVQALFGVRPCRGWCEEPSGTTENLYGIYGSGPLNIVAVGANNTIIKWDGQSWARQTIAGLGANQILRGVTIPRGSTNFIVVGNAGSIISQSSGTFSKLAAPPSGTKDLYAVGGARADEIFIVGETGTYLKGSVSGFTAKTPGGGLNDPPAAYASKNVYSISVSATADAHTSSGESGINTRRTRGGFAEDYFPNVAAGTTSHLNGIWYGSQYIVAVGQSGTLARRGPSNGIGNFPDWMVVASPPSTNTLNSVWAVNDNQVYAVGDNLTIVYFDGTTWAKVPLPNITTGPQRQLRGIWGTGANNIYAVGDNGTILHYLP